MSSSSHLTPSRRSNGRRKVRMAKMENPSNLQVTFSKRRAGLFKKASELCVLCGVEAAVVVFSPANKLYCFGHPNVETLVNKFLFAAQRTDNNYGAVDSYRTSTVRELNLDLVHVETMLSAERNRGGELDRIAKAGRLQEMFLRSFEGFSYSQLDALKEAGLKMKMDLDYELGKVKMANHGETTNPATKSKNLDHHVFDCGLGPATAARVSSFDPSLMPSFFGSENESNDFFSSGVFPRLGSSSNSWRQVGMENMRVGNNDQDLADQSCVFRRGIEDLGFVGNNISGFM